MRFGWWEEGRLFAGVAGPGPSLTVWMATYAEYNMALNIENLMDSAARNFKRDVLLCIVD